MRLSAGWVMASRSAAVTILSASATARSRTRSLRRSNMSARADVRTAGRTSGPVRCCVAKPRRFMPFLCPAVFHSITPPVGLSVVAARPCGPARQMQTPGRGFQERFPVEGTVSPYGPPGNRPQFLPARAPGRSMPGRQRRRTARLHVTDAAGCAGVAASPPAMRSPPAGPPPWPGRHADSPGRHCHHAPGAAIGIGPSRGARTCPHAAADRHGRSRSW